LKVRDGRIVEEQTFQVQRAVPKVYSSWGYDYDDEHALLAASQGLHY
jgi:hypothetical protein